MERERRRRERRKSVDARQDTVEHLRKALSSANSDNRYRHLTSRIQNLISEVLDVTMTIEKRGRSDRREITAPRLRVAGGA